MLTKDNLKEIAGFTGLKPYQQEEHYIQTIILHALASATTNELVFKGGTALFFFSGLRRFSEDLDFTMIKSLDKGKIINIIKKDFSLLGIINSIDKIEENYISLSFRIAVQGPLFNKEIEKCYVRVEISKRENVKFIQIKELNTLYPDIPSFSLNVMDEREIVAEKIRALMARNYARDLYDLFFLLNKKVPIKIELVNEKLSYYKKKFSKLGFKRSVFKKRDIWESELRPIIIGDLISFSEAKKVVFNAIKDQIRKVYKRA